MHFKWAIVLLDRNLNQPVPSCSLLRTLAVHVLTDWFSTVTNYWLEDFPTQSLWMKDYSLPHIVNLQQTNLKVSRQNFGLSRWMRVVLKMLCSFCHNVFKRLVLQMYQVDVSYLTRIQMLSDASAPDDFWKHCVKKKNCNVFNFSQYLYMYLHL